ncbi:MAG: WbqC family protein [Flavobacteriales bacterium]|nr:WbqC family protein [Flavobacteriales bacterium]
MSQERRTAIMQPYVFPYLGYYQLFHAADTFVSLDDAAFINKGWVNRNRLLLQGGPHFFTIPLSARSQNVSIRDTRVAPDDGWRRKLLTTLGHAYRKAPYFDEVYPIFERVLALPGESVADTAERSLMLVLDHLGTPRSIRRASELGLDPELHGQDRILAICGAVGTDLYVNPAGGRELYLAERFKERGIRLRFLRSEIVPYTQGTAGHFEPGLSMIDVLMWNSRSSVLDMMARYQLEE